MPRICYIDTNQHGFNATMVLSVASCYDYCVVLHGDKHLNRGIRNLPNNMRKRVFNAVRRGRENFMTSLGDDNIRELDGGNDCYEEGYAIANSAWDDRALHKRLVAAAKTAANRTPWISRTQDVAKQNKKPPIWGIVNGVAQDLVAFRKIKKSILREKRIGGGEMCILASPNQADLYTLIGGARKSKRNSLGLTYELWDAVERFCEASGVKLTKAIQAVSHGQRGRQVLEAAKNAKEINALARRLQEKASSGVTNFDTLIVTILPALLIKFGVPAEVAAGAANFVVRVFGHWSIGGTERLQQEVLMAVPSYFKKWTPPVSLNV